MTEHPVDSSQGGLGQHPNYNTVLGIWEQTEHMTTPLHNTSKPEEDMTKEERFHHDMHNMIGICHEMLAVIEGGDAFEDFDTFPALHHFSEIANFLVNRLAILEENMKSHSQLQDIKKMLKDNDGVWPSHLDKGTPFSAHLTLAQEEE